MARRRYISTEISTDPKLARLAQHGTLPMLLYTWAIPHMDDWGRLSADPVEFRLLVCPALNLSDNQVQEALEQIAEVGLWQLYTVEGRQYIAIPEEKWFRYQTYISQAKRGDTSASKIPAPQNTGERRETPQMAASPSPSPSPRKHMCVSGETHAPDDSAKATDKAAESEQPGQVSSRKRNEYEPEFEQFWAAYPRRKEKLKAGKAWAARIRAGEDGTTSSLLILAAQNYALECRRKSTQEDYIKLPATFLGPSKPYLDYLEPNGTASLKPPPDGFAKAKDWLEQCYGTSEFPAEPTEVPQ